MCGLFGFSDPKHTLTQKQIRRLTGSLATASEQRGTDASGIAYVQGQTLRIYKRPLPAHSMTWLVPAHTTAVMGHTRMTTQGSSAFNPNNHPFPGMCGDTRFALAHNGVLHNDDALKQRCHLPKTNIQTDSYVAVQLLEQDGRLDAEAIGNTAARLEGSFSLTILNQFNHLYLVKGNSPLCIYRFENGLICYASTADILKEALARCGFLPRSKEIITYHFDIGEFDMVVFDLKAASCAIYKVEYSTEITEAQYRHLIDEEKCKATEWRFGTITGKYVIYRGESCEVNGIHYLNVEEYLKGLA